MKPNLLVGDHLLVNKFIFAPTASALERALLPMRADSRAATSWCSSFPRSRSAISSSARSACPARRIELQEPDRVRQRPAARPSRTRTTCFRPPTRRRPTASICGASSARSRCPTGHYFMMGDNRDDSQDSRYWGFLPQSYVKGRALFIYWSFDTPDDGIRRRALRRAGAGYSTRFIDRLASYGEASRKVDSMKTIIKIVDRARVLRDRLLQRRPGGVEQLPVRGRGARGAAVRLRAPATRRSSTW